MWSSVAMWGGVAGVFVSLFSVVVLFLTRSNILDILDKDVLLFDKNFELKNSAITQAMGLIDEIDANPNAKYNAEFTAKAKENYNALLCVLSDVRLADEFYNITMDHTQSITKLRLIKFKIACRHDIGLRVKKTKALKRAAAQGSNISDQFGSYTMDSYSRDSFSVPSAPVQTPIVPTPIVAPPAPVAPAKPVAPKPSPMKTSPAPARPTAPPARPTAPMARPTAPARPTQPSTAAARPTTPMTRPQGPTRRKPSDDDKI